MTTDNAKLDPKVSLAAIRADKHSGAAEILERAAQVLRALDPPASAEEARSLIADSCRALVDAQPLMAPLVNLTKRVTAACEDCATAAEAVEAAALAARRFAEAARDAASVAALQAAALIGDGQRVVTHSRSSTVLRAFLAAARKGTRFEVIATESRPMLEGRVLARTLGESGIRVTLIADAAASLALDDADLVMLGADQVTQSGVVNKIGTRMIALAARAKASVRVTRFAIQPSSFATKTGKLQPAPDSLGRNSGIPLLRRFESETTILKKPRWIFLRQSLPSPGR
jgi:translation initiation factor 2B subunit (eIF-2B alpha/beta/delta family)